MNSCWINTGALLMYTYKEGADYHTMGCGQSDLAPPREGAPKKRRPHEKGNAEKVANPLAAATKTPQVDESQHMLGKHKYIVEAGAIAMDDRRNNVVCGTLLLFSPIDYSGIVMSYRDARSGAVYARELTDANLVKERDAAGITQGWAAFFKSLASDVMKCKAAVASTAQKVEVTVSIVSAKDAKVQQSFTLRLDLKGKAGSPAVPRDVFRYVLEPMTRMVQRKRITIGDKEKELRFAKLECSRIVTEASIVKQRGIAETLGPVVRPLRETAAAASKQVTELLTKLAAVERKVKRVDNTAEPEGTDLLPLDGVYEVGGARPYVHLPCADEHVPRDPEVNVVLCDALKLSMPTLGASTEYAAAILREPSQPHIQRLMEKAPRGLIENTFTALAKLDDWDYSCFEMERATGQNALFVTIYSILYKLDLINHFNIDDTILRNFLSAVQSGYHPNPYHSATHAADVTHINYFIITRGGQKKNILRNFLSAVQSGYHPNPYHSATHAADVTHINYFIITRGGLVDACRLSKEDLFAAVLAGAIHDYDHPGFNNNFHTRTNAYLSTLYNDRSILENHHCACIFEMMRLPKYNILAGLTPEQRIDVRDVMVEMVLSTDMGNHAKIFSSFRRRMTDGIDWSARRDDIRLALSMSIKMADISNCGRPNSLYVEWAKNIAVEFYNQGDVEAKMKLTISPFMDRRKDKSDFPKGQTSFMTYIVQPMLEAIAEFLPPMEFAVQHCNENKAYWQKQDSS
ncbi:cAMP-phosphodiesterase D, putative [Bodo saltans]|uniref:Phosphodiesterase n=1 Tax=Bodo saltans TaxID=75058 RepID=A0A0S4IPG9_BODSA|nr:cAMP-phosphodiesterase D, putative [Bodo saltans]|eukprot:CUF07986.1 cAMP-phosphodiesterase D, putative [Bodo saltans]